jgi:hypothetical protein
MYIPDGESRDRSWIFEPSIQKHAALKSLCQRVEARFQLPEDRLCRYFADSDDPYLIQMPGAPFLAFFARSGDLDRNVGGGGWTRTNDLRIMRPSL